MPRNRLERLYAVDLINKLNMRSTASMTLAGIITVTGSVDLQTPLRTSIATTAAAPPAGRTTLGSGQATVTVSTAAVAAASAIFLGVQQGTSVAQTSHSNIVVRSINPGVAFTVGPANNAAISPADDLNISWMIFRVP